MVLNALNLHSALIFKQISHIGVETVEMSVVQSKSV